MRIGVLALTLAIACAPAAPPAPTAVLVIVDTLRRDALGCYGGPSDATPAIDALARDGLRFEQAIASSCWTLPSVASLLTGTWPELHKAVGQKTLLSPVSTEIPLAAELFGAAGFATVAVVNAAFLSPLLGLDRGFEVYDHEHAYNRTMRRARATVDAALAHTAARAGEPLFLVVHLFDPHLDYDAPRALGEGFGARSAGPGPPLSRKAALALGPEELEHIRALYQGEVALVDAAIARLIEGLRELGRWDDATLILTADHGEEFWDHGGFEHGHTLYDELIHVPLIVKLPVDHARPRPLVEEQVRGVDVLPTLLELYKIDAPPSCAGRSLSPLFAGAPDAPRVAFSQDTLYGTDLLSWRDARHHYIHDRGAGVERRGLLFDWRVDPRGEHDLSLREPERAEAMRAELARFYTELRERAARIPATDALDMGPTRVRELLESLESLGYAGEGR